MKRNSMSDSYSQLYVTRFAATDIFRFPSFNVRCVTKQLNGESPYQAFKRWPPPGLVFPDSSVRSLSNRQQSKNAVVSVPTNIRTETSAFFRYPSAGRLSRGTWLGEPRETAGPAGSCVANSLPYQLAVAPTISVTPRSIPLACRVVDASSHLLFLPHQPAGDLGQLNKLVA